MKTQTNKPKLIDCGTGKTKLLDNLPILQLIAAEWHLNLNRAKDFKIAVRIMNNCIKYN